MYLGRDPSNARVVIRTFVLPRAWRDSTEPDELLDSFRTLCADGPDHPGIARPIAFGIEGDIPYLVSTYLQGTRMDASAPRNGGRSLDEALHRVTAIAEAIDCAAASGVVHGMLEPGDIILEPGGTGVTGFGLAQALLRVGIPVEGRSPYASPQRLAGERPTSADDVYSLAAIALELIIGKSPESARDSSGAVRYAEGLPERRRVARPAPHETRLFTTLAGVDAGILRAVFAAAFSNEPESRPPTAAAFVAGFKEALSGRRGSEHEPLVAAGPAASSTDAPMAIDVPFRHESSEPEMNLFLADAIVREPLLVAGHPHFPALFDDPPPAPRGGRRLGVAAAVLAGVLAGFAGGFVVGQRAAPVSQAPAAAAQAQADRPVATDARAAAPAPGVAAPEPAAPVESPEPVTEPVVPAAPAAPAPAAAAPAAPVPAAPAPEVPATQPVRPLPSSGRLLVRSMPAGATVAVDGQSRGVTPLALRDLALGDHTIEVRYNGYDTRQQQVTLTAGRPSRSVDFVLRPTETAGQALTAAGAPGALQVFSRPAGAEVFLDDRLIGTTPLLVSSVPAGSHRVRLELVGFQAWSTSVQIEPGVRFRVAASLEP